MDRRLLVWGLQGEEGKDADCGSVCRQEDSGVEYLHPRKHINTMARERKVQLASNENPVLLFSGGRG